MQRRLLLMAVGLSVGCRAGSAHAQLIETWGAQVAKGLRAIHPQLVVATDDRFIVDRTSSGIQVEHINPAVRWKGTDRWSDCSFQPGLISPD